MGFFSSLFSAASKKHQMIEWAIETLGREGSIVGTAYKEISYNDVQSYMQKSTCRPINSIKDAQNGWAVAGAECNTVIELKQAQHDAFPPLLS